MRNGFAEVTLRPNLSNRQQSIQLRHLKHHECVFDACITTPWFYHTYPSISIDNLSINPKDITVDFDKLCHYSAVTFDVEENNDVISFENKGLFILDKTPLERLETIYFVGCMPTKEKKLVMVGYKLETEFHILISSDDNFSDN